MSRQNYYEERTRKWGEEFRKWQNKFYKSKQWLQVRDQVRNEHKNRCSICGKFIRGRYIIDHITPITPDNKDDPNITLNPDNCRCLCIACHNQITFGEPVNFDLHKRNDINLF